VREFKGVEGWIRRHFYIYKLARQAAPFLCRFMTLEEGFDFLGSIKPANPLLAALDIGANDGTSIRMIRQNHPKSQIVAFDPIMRPHFDISDIDFRDYALGDSPGSFRIFTPVVKNYYLSQYSSLYREKLISQVSYDLGVSEAEINVQEKSINVYTLDSLRLAPFFIKIDVEGAEMQVLRGGSETIDTHQPIILIEIQNQKTYTEVSVFMSALDYMNILTSPKGNLSNESVHLNANSSYLPDINNYIWIPRKPSPSWHLTR